MRALVYVYAVGLLAGVSYCFIAYAGGGSIELGLVVALLVVHVVGQLLELIPKRSGPRIVRSGPLSPSPTEGGGNDRRETEPSDSYSQSPRSLSRRPLYSRRRLKPIRRRILRRRRGRS